MHPAHRPSFLVEKHVSSVLRTYKRYAGVGLDHWEALVIETLPVPANMALTTIMNEILVTLCCQWQLWQHLVGMIAKPTGENDPSLSCQR